MGKGSNTFGGTVKLDGESEYKKALSHITTQLSVVASEMNKVTVEFGKNDKSVEGLTAKDKVLNDRLQAQQEKVELLKGALESAKKEYGETDDKTLKWQKSLNNAEADVIKTKNQIEDLGKETEDTGKKAEKSGEGFTVFKGILANLGSDAIEGVINSFKKMGSTMLDIGKLAINSYADYEQLIGGVETLFKDSSEIVQDYANNAYKTAGLSANDYMETVTSFSASLLQSLNNDTAKSAEVADMAITDMSDNANKMGTDMSMIQNAYQGFAKQNYTMLDNLKLGYGGTKNEMERLLSDAEKISGIKYDISNLSDVYNAIHVIQEELDITGTTSKEASSTISGSLSSMKSAWSNLLTGIADENADFDTLINNMVDSIMTFGDNILPRVKTTLNGLSKLIKDLLPKIAEEIPGLLQDLLPSLIDGCINLISSLSNSLPSLIPVLMNGIVQAFTGITDILPEILDSLIKATVLIIQSLAEQMPVLIPKIIDAILEMIPVLIDNLPLFIKAGYQLITGILQGIIQSYPILLSYIPKICKSIIDYFKQLPGLMLDVGKNLVKGLWNGINNVKDWLFDKIKGFKDAILKKFKNLFGIHSPSTLFRDEIGSYLAKGLGVGFVNEMDKIAVDMKNAIPTDFNITPNVETGFVGKKYVEPINNQDNLNGSSNFTAIINNNSKYTTPSDNVRLLRNEYELYNLKYGRRIA